MELAKISTNGQITVPVEIRRQLNLRSGDKILFVENRDGDIVLRNASEESDYERKASLDALRVAQADFAGVAKEMGLETEEDVQKLVDEIRYGKK